MKKELPCVVCKKNASISPSYTSAYYCKTHFRALIEKRVRKDLRISKLMTVKLPYFLEEDDSPLTPLTKDLLNSIFEGRLHLSDDATLPLAQHIFPLCLEQYVSDQFKAFLDAQALEKQGVYPLRSVSFEDIGLLLPYADLSSMEQNVFLSALEANQSGSNFSMAHVFEFLKHKEE